MKTKGIKGTSWRIIYIISIFIVFSIVSFAWAQGISYDKAIAAYAKKDFKTAINYLKEYVAEKPDAQAYYLLGYASYKIRNMEESARYFREAYLIDPGFIPVIIKFEKK